MRTVNGLQFLSYEERMRIGVVQTGEQKALSIYKGSF